MALWPKRTTRWSEVDWVFARCRDPMVRCWDAPNDFGLRIALFLQLHDQGADRALPDGEARVRLAYRNTEPESVTFTRSLRCEEGRLAKDDPGRTFTMLAGRGGLVLGSVRVGREPDGALVHADIEFSGPKEFGRLEVQTLSIGFPGRGTAIACPCCPPN